MSEYTIKEFQTGIDVVNQLFGDQDHISDLMLVNTEFNINNMQQDLVVTYTEPTTNQLLNNIKNNNSTFVNRENIVYTLLDSIVLDKGLHSLSTYSDYYNKAYIKNISTDTIFYLSSTNNFIKILEDGQTVEIWVELFE